MKLLKKMLFVLVFVSLLTVSFACKPKHEHKYGEWEFTTTPTMEVAGKAKKACECGDVVEEEVAKLSDSSVWTVKETVDSTCSVAGKKVYTSVYGEITVAIEKTAHNPGEWKLSVNPTESKEGVLERECSVCGEKETTSVSKLTDTTVWTLKEEVKATCTAEGKKVYTSVYGEVEVVLEKTSHNYGAWKLTVNPTETESGKAEHVCECGEKEEVTVPALTDAKVWTLKEEIKATCATEGKKVYTSVYGKVTVVLAKVNHEYGAWKLTVNPTETESGKAEHVCKYGEKEEVTVPALTDAKVWTVKEEVKSSCSVAGKKVYTSVYGEVTVTLPKNTHSYSEWFLTKESSLEETGKAERFCNECGEKEEVTVPALTDEKVWTKKVIVEVTCENGGETLYTSVYGEVTVYSSPVAHEYSSWKITSEPTEFVSGLAERTCKYGETEEVLIAKLSDTTVWTLTKNVEATCANAGEKVYTSIYGEVTVVLEKLPHAYGEWILTVEPTLEETGKAERTCKFGEKDEVIVPVLTDTSVWSSNVIVPVSCSTDGKTEYTSIYGKVLVVTPVSGHVYGSWALVEKPTLTKGGSAIRYCTCGISETATVPALTDTSVWTITEEVKATCTAEGKQVYTSIYGEVIVVLEKTSHTYGEWTLTLEPTLNTTGKAERKCECGSKEEVEAAKLSDTTVWTLIEDVKATCAAEGKQVYTSVYGEVIIVLEKLPHTYGEWKLATEPTLTEKGTAERECECGAKETKDVPALSDSYWTLVDEVKPTCDAEGKQVYESELGQLTLVIEKLPHTFGKWTVVKMPTLTEKGEEERTCSQCSKKETRKISELTDKSVWAVIDEVPSTCEVKGSRTYKSTYGEVVVELELAPHSLESYTIVNEPTLEAAGTAKGLCLVCNNEVEVEIPSLSDKAWSLMEEVKPDYNKKGSQKYASIYGEVTIEVKKLVAPYDGKTYHAFSMEADDADEIFEERKAGTSWINAVMTVGENSVGTGEAFPFRGTYTFKMIDPETGKIEISDEDTTYPAFVDFETGIIVRAFRNSFNYVLVYTPFALDEGNTVNASGSAWTNGMAIEYVTSEKTYKIFVNNRDVYFNVSFEGTKVGDTDNKVGEILAGRTFEAQFLYVKDAKGNLIQALANTGEDLVKSDKFGGYYVQGGTSLFVSGNGILRYQASKDAKVLEGTYYIATGEKYTLDAYLDGAYYEVTLQVQYKTFTTNKPMIKLTFDSGDKAELKTLEYNKNIVAELYEPLNDSFAFKGWYYDAELKTKVEDDFKPVKDITLYAAWKPLVIVNLNNVMEGDKSVLRLGEGDVIGDYLPQYGKDLEKMLIFRGWYLDPEFEIELPEESELTVDDSGIEIYAKWEAIPQYYGTYYGTEIWNKAYGNSGGRVLSIDENGNITGFKTGKVESYDKETQTIVWYQTSNVSRKLKMYFDEETGVIAGIYNDNEIGNDYYILSRNLEATNGKVTSTYGVKNAKSATNTQRGFYSQFVQLETKKGLTNIYLYDNHIYSNIVIIDANGKDLPISEIRNSKTVIVKDATTNEIILALAAKDETFDKTSDTVSLDPYFGTYVNGEETVILDGTGIITYGTKKGKYTKVEDADYDFDVYLGNNEEYYRLTLNGESFTIEKTMVEINFVVGEGHNEITSITWNMNIVCPLPSGEEEGYVFNGYFLDPEFTKPVTLPFVPTQSLTLYAKHSLPAVVTIVYNNGSENTSIIYSQGDKTNIERPTYKKHIFVGWYTDPSFTAGTEWTSGNEIYEDVTIYAKWEDAPIYNDDYYPVEIKNDGKKVIGSDSAYVWSTCLMKFDPYGVANTTAYPFQNCIVTISDYDAVKGTLTITVEKGSTKTVYNGFIDTVSGIIIISNNASNPIKNIFMLVPAEKANSKNTSAYQNTYWNYGSTRVIEYNDGETVHKIYIEDGNVYFNVTFKDAEGNDVSAKEANTATNLFVRDSEGTVIAKCGYDGTTMVKFDGYEGTYTNGTDLLIVDGVKTVTYNSVKGQYYLSTLGDCTLYAFIGKAYYEVILDKDTYTFTITKPEVTISYVTDGKATLSDDVVSKKVPYELPTPTNPDYVFRGWYKDNALTEKVESPITLLEDITLYAKWAPKVTLTVVYGNGYETATIEYGEGEKIVLANPKAANGKSFTGWFTDPECTVKYTLGTMDTDLTIYAGWIDAHPLYGDYIGKEFWKQNIYSSSNYVSIDKDGNITKGDRWNFKTGKITSINANGTITYDDGKCAFADVDNGVILINYSSPYATSISNDQFIFIKGCTALTAKGSALSDGITRFVTFTLTGSEQATMNVFVYKNRVYGNVTWVSATEGAVTAESAADASGVSVYDSTGSLIVTLN